MLSCDSIFTVAQPGSCAAAAEVIRELKHNFYGKWRAATIELISFFLIVCTLIENSIFA